MNQLASPEPERQRTFEFAHRVGMDLVDFMPAPSNRRAYDMIMAWPDWPTPALILHGPIGSGRTHLARIWADRSKARYFEAAEIWEAAKPIERLDACRHAVVDGADRIVSERLLFHLYNLIVDRRGTLLLVADASPGRWSIQLPDLHSRLQAALPVQIDPPCDDLLAALLVKQFADRQVRIEPAVVSYLVRHMERSFAAVRRMTLELDRVSLCAQRPITLPLARAMLEWLEPEATNDEDIET